MAVIPPESPPLDHQGIRFLLDLGTTDIATRASRRGRVVLEDHDVGRYHVLGNGERMFWCLSEELHGWLGDHQLDYTLHWERVAGIDIIEYAWHVVVSGPRDRVMLFKLTWL